MSAMTKRRFPGTGRGFSLIELMVAMVIALLATLAIFQTFAVFEGQKRTTVSGADAQEGGLMALNAIEVEVRMAGLGTAGLNCDAINAYNEVRVPPDYVLSTVPVLVEQDTPAAGSDRITLFYADSRYGAIPATITSPMPDSSAELNVNFGLGFRQGNLYIVSEGTKPCSIIQGSQNGQKTGTDWNVQHNPGGSYPYNPPGGHNIFPPGGYGKGAKVSDLGTLVNLQFFVANSQLMVRDLNRADDATNPLALLGDIVALRAQYGRDTNADGFIDVWDNAAGVTKKQVLAVRLGIIARSSRFEKDEVTTAAVAFWPGGPTFVPAGDDRYFRYKVYNTIVPLRNVLWNP
jgi:type IV pilus assembly protein PilW